MIRQYFQIVLACILTLCFTRCAQVVPLSGGARDATPPKLIESLPKQEAVNFNSNEIILRFDEYVQLKDLKNQLLISPKLKTDPEINVQGKKVQIILKSEELIPNTTYRLYFGKSIADMTEGNTIPNFEYVFSTGNYIDSLKLKGTVIEAFNEKAAGDILVGLYDVNKLNDSLVYKETPDYVTRSLGNGNFDFGNLPDKQFKIVAFTDKNKNYLYDGESEKIAFADSLVKTKTDTVIQLKIFKEEFSKTYIKKISVPYYGVLNVIYNKKSLFKTAPTNKSEKTLIIEEHPGREKDTVTFYYNNIKDTISVTVTELGSVKTDTVKMVLPKINSRKKALNLTTSIINGVLPVNSALTLNFISSIDSSKTNAAGINLIYLKDSVNVSEPVELSYNFPVGVIIKNKLREDITYKLKIDTAVFFDLSGRYNDSSIIDFKLQNKTELGKITLKVLLNKKQSYIVQLINDKEQVVKEDYLSLSLSSSNAVSIDFTDIPPGAYVTKIIFDNNNNKKWDTGNYLSNKQAEKVYISSKQIKVLADWEMEEEILIK